MKTKRTKRFSPHKLPKGSYKIICKKWVNCKGFYLIQEQEGFERKWFEAGTDVISEEEKNEYEKRQYINKRRFLNYHQNYRYKETVWCGRVIDVDNERQMEMKARLLYQDHDSYENYKKVFQYFENVSFDFKILKRIELKSSVKWKKQKGVRRGQMFFVFTPINTILSQQMFAYIYKSLQGQIKNVCYIKSPTLMIGNNGKAMLKGVLINPDDHSEEILDTYGYPTSLNGYNIPKHCLISLLINTYNDD